MTDRAMQPIESPPLPRRGYERRDVHASALVLAALALAATLVGVQIPLRWFSERLISNADSRQPYISPLAAPATPPPPLLQATPAQDLRAYQDEQAAILHHYEWIDRKDGSLRIPIERAMQLVAARGLPATQFPDNRIPPEAEDDAEDSAGGQSPNRAEPAAEKSP